MNAAEVTDKLGLHTLRNRNWYIQVNILGFYIIIFGRKQILKMFAFM